MDAGVIEPRTAMWAKAEVCWEDAGGKAIALPATIEDTSASGACLRIATPISLGSKLTIRWRKEQFGAIARNCRQEGADFLLGVQRDRNAAIPGGDRASVPPAPSTEKTERTMPPPVAEAPLKTKDEQAAVTVTATAAENPSNPAPAPTAETSIKERTTMESKSVFPKFWRREPSGSGASANSASVEVPVPRRPSAPVARPKGDLLSYEDIYCAAGILRSRSGFDIAKVVEMLHSDRIRGLSDEVRRASVLMAIESAGASPEDLLRDATERQQALERYEAGQRKQLEQYEAQKAQENAQIEAEMVRITAHYAERIKANLDQVASEREALRNWQMAKQHETQRIGEVIELCTKPAEPQIGVGAPAAGRASSGPSLVSGVVSARPN